MREMSAARDSLQQAVQSGQIRPDDVTDELFEQCLYTGVCVCVCVCVCVFVCVCMYVCMYGCCVCGFLTYALHLAYSGLSPCGSANPHVRRDQAE